MFEEHLRNTVALLRGNPAIAIAIAGFIAVLFYRKPKEMFKLLVFCLFIAVVFYFITLFAGTVSTGAKQKDQMIYKSKESLGE